MIDYGLISLLVIQLVMVGACIFVFFRIQGERASINDKLDRMDKALAASEGRAMAATEALAVSNELPKTFTKKQEIFETELNALSRSTEKLEMKVTSALARMSANKRWEKREGVESDEEEVEEQSNVIRKFGHRRVG